MPIPQRASILTRRQLSRPSVNSSMTGLFKNTPGKFLCSFQGFRANASRRPQQSPLGKAVKQSRLLHIALLIGFALSRR